MTAGGAPVSVLVKMSFARTLLAVRVSGRCEQWQRDERGEMVPTGAGVEIEDDDFLACGARDGVPTGNMCLTQSVRRHEANITSRGRSHTSLLRTACWNVQQMRI